MYEGIDDPSLPEEVKNKGATERSVFIAIYNPLFVKYGEVVAERNAMNIMNRWINRDLAVRGA